MSFGEGFDWLGFGRRRNWGKGGKGHMEDSFMVGRIGTLTVKEQ